MRYCNKCKVTIENDNLNCPLCNLQTTKINNKFENDFPNGITLKKENTLIIKKIIFFIFIFLLGLNVLLDVILSTKIIWAPYAIVPLLYAYIIIKLGIRSYRAIGTIIMSGVFTVSIICIIIDTFLGFTKWSFNYVIPFSVLAGILALFIFIFIKPTYFINYLLSMLTTAFLGISILIFLLNGYVTVRIPSIIAVFVSFMAVIALFLFGDREIRHELGKRFHF
ncbi:MAG: DUF6320 domain-containing protein [Bacilli bacterium]|nr:DUF6320 domain-containing protein [Bacilli bacterium]